MYRNTYTATAAQFRQPRAVTIRDAATVTVDTDVADTGERTAALVTRLGLTDHDGTLVTVELTALETENLARALIHAANLDPDSPAPRSAIGDANPERAAAAARRRTHAALDDLRTAEPADRYGTALAAASGLTGRINGPQEKALARLIVPLWAAADAGELPEE